MTPERRECERFPIPGATVDWRSLDTALSDSDCPLGDLSRGGARFFTPGPPEAGELVEVNLHIPGEDAPLHVRGRVVWRQASSGQIKTVALAFEPYGSGNDPTTLERLVGIEARFLRSKSTP